MLKQIDYTLIVVSDLDPSKRAGACSIGFNVEDVEQT